MRTVHSSSCSEFPYPVKVNVIITFLRFRAAVCLVVYIAA
jgi:hypothetical protein